MKRCLSFSVVLMLLTVALSGCIGNVHLSDRAIVQAIGVDRGEGGEYRAVIQVFTATGGSAEAGAQHGITVARAQGETISELIAKASLVNGKQFFVGSLRLVVFGENMAREGIGETLHFLNSSNQISPTIHLAVAHGEAEELISSAMDNSKLSADEIVNLLDGAQKSGFAPSGRLMDVIAAVDTPNSAAFIPILELNTEKGKNKKPLIAAFGAALFHADKLETILKIEDTHGLSWLQNKTVASVVSVNDKDIGRVGAITHRQHTKTTAELVGDNIVFDFNVGIRASLVETDFPDAEQSETATKYAGLLLEQEIKSEIENSINESLRKGYDPLELFAYVRQKFPDFYNNNNDRWSEVMKSAGYTVNVKLKFDRSGAAKVAKDSNFNS